MLHQGLKAELSDILYQRVAFDPTWHVDLGHGIAGNYTIERFIADVQHNIDTKNEKEWSHYLAHAHGYRYEDGEIDQPPEEWKIAETCDRWELVRYEAYPGMNQTYQAIVVLFYQPVLS